MSRASINNSIFRLSLVALIWLITTHVALAQGTPFTYQGKLTDGGNPSNGTFDFQVKLFDTVTVGTGVQQGGTVIASNVQVTSGIFTVQLDFGSSVFPGVARFLEALNRDLRYQLTVIGTFAQAIVARKVTRNRFTIKTNAPRVEVSWQVTGVRSDAVMQTHPFKAEEDKPESERGTYLNPAAFDKPVERGTARVRDAEIIQQLLQQRSEAGRPREPQKQISRRTP